MKTKKNRSAHNITKKCRPRQNELKILCREHANTFNQFEETYEKGFKESLTKHHQNIERELIKLFKTELVQINLLFILFGIISFYIGDIIQAGLGIYFISDTNVHFVFTEVFLTIRLIASNGLIILGLLWKN